VQFERRTEASAKARLLRPDWPETGLEEINSDFLEADFWTTSRYLAEITDAI
jgi:hypothetical protein